MRRLVIAMSSIVLACAPAVVPVAPGRVAPVAPRPPRLAASALPSLERWRQHVTEDILPFWTTPAALGTPIGNFPTFRCNDGAAFLSANPGRHSHNWRKPSACDRILCTLSGRLKRMSIERQHSQ